MDTTQSSNFPPLEQSLTPEEMEKLKTEKLQAWWKLCDEIANGSMFTSDDLDLVIENISDPVIKNQIYNFFHPVMGSDNVIAFLSAYNAARPNFGGKLKEKVKQEQELRKEVVKFWFPDPKEGTNKTEIGNEWSLKLMHKINRTVDEAAYDATATKLREMGINTDKLTRTTHEVAIAEYRALENLNKEAFKIFEGCLIIKPAAPVLELVPPKEKK